MGDSGAKQFAAPSLARHNNMAAIHAKDTKPEIIVRKHLWQNGFRYRLNHKRLPGKPDIVLRKYKTCIFINGCFWHGHNSFPTILPDQNTIELTDSKCCKIPKSNRNYWTSKIARNQERDVEVQHKLAKMGWHCITIWECQLNAQNRDNTLRSLIYTLNKIFLLNHKPFVYNVPQEEELYIAAEEQQFGTD